MFQFPGCWDHVIIRRGGERIPSPWLFVDFLDTLYTWSLTRLLKGRAVLSCGFHTILCRDWKATAQETLRAVAVALLPYSTSIPVQCAFFLPENTLVHKLTQKDTEREIRVCV